MKILYIEQNTTANQSYGVLMKRKIEKYGACLEQLFSFDEGLKRIKESQPNEFGKIICGSFGDRPNNEGKFVGEWKRLASEAQGKGTGVTLITGLTLGNHEIELLNQEGIRVIDKGEFDRDFGIFLEQTFPSAQEKKQ